MYVIVRKDLSAGAQLSQSCHVCFNFATEHPEITSSWMNNSNYICVLEANDENHLKNILQEAKAKNIATSYFYEPDFNNSLTAIALAPGKLSKKICNRLKLALKNL